MEIRRIVSKRRLGLLLLVLFVLLLLCLIASLAEPLFAHRLTTKMYARYEIYLLKYPHSQFVVSETRATSKVTMATDYTYHTPDDIDTVRKYMEQKMPEFVRLEGPRVINEPTYSNSTCADETSFKYFFQVLGRVSPCVEVKIYPSDTGGTSIIISENWYSAGFPAWLRRL